MKPARRRACILSCAFICSGAMALEAQTIEGHLLDAETGEPLAEALVELLDGESVILRSRTDEEGRFVLAAARPGTYQLHSTRVGYLAGVSVPLALTAGQTRIVHFRLAPDAVELETLTVERRPRPRLPTRHVFYERRERLERSGQAHFVDRAHIEEQRPRNISDILRMVPGIRLSAGRTSMRDRVVMRGNCEPSIHIDGHLVRPLPGQTVNEMIHPEAVEGIEIYLTPGLAGRFVDPNPWTRPCGAIVIWTRERH
jgi:5-hydroxyisourate hydrolase-like protein (transthyretin family)